MRNTIGRGLLVLMLAALPAAAFAKNTSSQGHGSATTAPSGSHVTSGVVKSINDNTLVVTRSAKQGGDMSFTLDLSTHRAGDIVVGAPVSVRYRNDRETHVATAITAKETAPKAAVSTTSSK